MSEVRYRGQLREILASNEFDPDRVSFIESLLASILPISEQLGQALEGDPRDDWQLLDHAVHTVAALRLNDFVPGLIRLFAAAPDNPLQFNILNTLQGLDHERINPFLLSIVVNKQELTALRGIALNGLQKKWPAMIAPLLALAQDTSDNPYLRGTAIRTLAEQNDKSLLPAILPLLNDAEAPVRYEAVGAVSVLGDISLAGHLEPLLEDTASLNGQIVWAVQYTLHRWKSL